MKIVPVVVAFIAIMLVGFFAFSTRIEPGYVGVQVNTWGSGQGVNDIALKTPGRIWYQPWKTDIIKFPTFMQTAVWTAGEDESSPNDESISFPVEGQPVSTDVALTYTINPSQVPHIYVKFHQELETIQDSYLRNLVRKTLSDIASKYSQDSFIANQSTFMAQVREDLSKKLEKEGFLVDAITFTTAPRYPDSMVSAINERNKATQVALQKERELAQTTAEAAKTVASAKGTAEARLTTAKANAEAIIMEAEAEAKAIRLKTAALNEHYINYSKIQKWDGAMPKYTGTGGMILQIPSN